MRRSHSAITLLADAPTRAILLALGDASARGEEAVAITEHPFPGVTPRLVRDRLRALERLGVTVTTDRAAGHGGPALWTLSAAGRDLYHLYALLERIASHAAELPASATAAERTAALDLALGTLNDHAATRLLEALALSSVPLDPPALEAAVSPVPRRTLYRRLTPLVDAKVVHRIVGRTVPRSTTYALNDRWRPAAAIAVLSLWWESRHWDDVQLDDSDALRAVLHALAPVVRGAPSLDRGATLRWRVTQDVTAVSGLIKLTDGQFMMCADAPSQLVDAEISGTPAAWASALVNERTASVAISGDETLTRDVLAGLRAALLTYVR